MQLPSRRTMCTKGHYKKDCPKLRNKNQGNQARNGNVVAKAFGLGMSVQTQTPIPFPSEAEIPLPPTSPAYAQAPLGYRATMMRAASPPTHHPLPLPTPFSSRRADIPEADIPHQKRLLFTAPTPRFEVGESFDPAAARQSGSTMARRDAWRDHAALHDEVDTLRRYLCSLCTTHEQERVEACQALDRPKDHNRAFEACIAIQALEARARVDTLEDTGSSA
ncbi:hypothetical protein Tco_1097663 [Tanacetum coccineum]